MYRKLTQQTDRIAGFRVGGDMSRDDFGRVTRQVEDSLREHGSPICLLVEIPDLSRTGAGALWDDLRLSVKHWQDIAAMAVVGDSAELKRWIRVGGRLMPAELRFFDTDRAHEAWEWLRDRDRELLAARVRETMEREPDPIRKVLVAVDLTPGCHFVVRTARMLADRLGAGLALIHVVDFIPALSMGYGWAEAIPEDPAVGELEAPALDRLRVLAGELRLERPELLARRGDPRTEILKAADEIGADLIILGDKSRRGLGRLLGSTANGVVHGSNRNVMTVPVPKLTLGAHGESVLEGQSREKRSA